jgi:putative ABC transport system permease protein
LLEWLLPPAAADRLVRPLPDELFFLDSHQAQALAERTNTLESFAAWSRSLFSFTNRGQAEEVRGARVDWNHFDMLGMPASLGRTFVRDDAVDSRAIILSHGLWQRRFGADPAVVGSTITMYQQSMVVIGVMGPDHVPMEFDWQAWRTLPLDPEQYAESGLAANGRLREGITLAEARQDFRRVVTKIWAEGGYTASAEDRAGMDLVPIREWLIGDAGQGLVVLSIAVAFLLVLACANVANLVLAQGGHGRASSRCVALLGEAGAAWLDRFSWRCSY